MALNICALTIAKATGTDIPGTQLVFLRAVTGLLVMLPWIGVAASVSRRRRHRAFISCGSWSRPWR